MATVVVKTPDQSKRMVCKKFTHQKNLLTNPRIRRKPHLNPIPIQKTPDSPRPLNASYALRSFPL
jgi:hypothetical protein